jgi:hypothetical protein
MDAQTAVDAPKSTWLSVSHYAAQILLLQYKCNYYTIKSKHVYLHTAIITTRVLFTAQQTT